MLAAAGVDHEVEEVDAGVLADEEQPHTQCLQQIVDKVELHRHQVPALPALLGSLAQALHILGLCFHKPELYIYSVSAGFYQGATR